MTEDTGNLDKVITGAGILNILGLILIRVSLLKLTTITLIVSITFRGFLIVVAVILYLNAVIQDLRIRKVLRFLQVLVYFDILFVVFFLFGYVIIEG